MWAKWIASCKEYGWDPNFSKKPAAGGDLLGTPAAAQSPLNQGGESGFTHGEQSAGGDLMGTPADAPGVDIPTVAE